MKTEVSYEAHYLTDAFPRAFIKIVNGLEEIIVEPKANEYFIIGNCETEKDVQAKVLEWLSRGACKTQPFRGEKQNKIFREYMQTGINTYLDTDFAQEDFELIYHKLGNAINHNLTMKFIESGFDTKELMK